MLTLKRLKWSNCFSYGDGNVLELNQSPLTQLVGSNGAGKTSISLMIQEILYGKNSKNIKKQDITNNKSGKKGYSICLFFEKDGIDYSVHLTRTTNLKFKLYKEDEDISSHTSLGTYKTLSDIIGISDFKVFCQLIYQHSTDSLDFLTATDTNRKKFLISLLQLDRYLELHELFKDKVKTLNAEINVLEGSVSVIESWIRKHKDMDFLKRDLLEEPEVPQDWYDRKAEYAEKILNINSINRKISSNNEYLKQLSELDSKFYLNTAPPRPSPSSQELQAQARVLESKISGHQSKINKLLKIEGICPSCLQEVDEALNIRMIDEESDARDELKGELKEIWNKIPDIQIAEQEVAKYISTKAEFERLSQLIDYSLPKVTLDLEDLKGKLSDINGLIFEIENRRKAIQAENLKISAHNSKVDVVKQQLDQMNEDLRNKNIELVEKENLNIILDLLKKTFSTNGLVSYKIESSVKELEKKINEYLAELTYFQIYFKLSGEKLNIEVVDDLGNITSISNLSSGERARVNIATILAIRNILSSLTSTKINLLFLDEVIGVIDAEGKEKLSEILLNENLNTFIVSHDWNHPLIPKINIIKEHHISRIEYD